MIDSWLDVLALTGFAPFVLFVGCYLFLPWWRNVAGRSVMLLAVVAALALSQSVWRQIADAAPPPWYRMAVFIAVIVAGWWQLMSLLVVMRRARNRRRRG